MNLQELKRLAAKGESDRLKFKRTTGQRTDAAKTVCAMLNGLGGFVIVGVGDKGELVGQEIGQRTVEEVTNESVLLSARFISILNSPSHGFV
jgi:ATP-dependent DNA helicase RecG